MEKLVFKNIQFLWGIGFALMGVLLIMLITGSFRYVGFAFLILAFIYFIRILFSKFGSTTNESFKSRTRERISKYKRKR